MNLLVPCESYRYPGVLYRYSRGRGRGRTNRTGTRAGQVLDRAATGRASGNGLARGERWVNREAEREESST